MPLPRERFSKANELGLEVGQHVRWTARGGLTGQGTITLIWLGIEECVEVRPAGTDVTVSLFPTLGDQLDVINAAGPRQG